MLSILKRNPIIHRLSELPFLSQPYHYLLAFAGALRYGFPSRKLTVIGVTGTKGKTSTCALTAQILTAAGHKVGLATTVNFKIGEQEWVNDTKQTMLGRFDLQKLLRDMVDAGCRYAVVETSSEGILQYRQRFIDYRVAVFTNLSPEHIERHGSFEKYRAAKAKLFEQVAKQKDGIGVYNLDDENASYFLEPRIHKQYGYTVKNQRSKISAEGGSASGGKDQNLFTFEISNIQLSVNKTIFEFDSEFFEMPLLGEFNVYNAAAAICVARSQSIPLAKIKSALKGAQPPAGRLELINQGQNFAVIVDYAHEPASLEAVYGAVKVFRPKRIIGVLGSQGGGRDKWKREAMGKIAAENCDQIILTNEDSYDEDPIEIIKDIRTGIVGAYTMNVKEKQVEKEFPAANIFEIIDRRAAIQKAISLARAGDAVVVTGKGGEVWMCVANGKKIPWSDRKIVEDILKKKSDK